MWIADAISRQRGMAMAVLIAAAGLASCIEEEDEGPEWSVGVGDTVPRFSVSVSDGRTVSTGDLEGKRSLIAFFNTTCPDCRRELPVLQQAYDCVKTRKDVEFLCIARSEDATPIASYWAEAGLTMPYSPQPDRRIYDKFASTGIPRIYIVDEELHIAASYAPEAIPPAQTLVALLGS